MKRGVQKTNETNLDYYTDGGEEEEECMNGAAGSAPNCSAGKRVLINASNTLISHVSICLKMRPSSSI